jgi:sulfofructose kinase
MLPHPEFVALGHCNLDHLCLLPHIPHDSKVEMLEQQIQGGGPAASAAVCAARLGMSSAFIGTVGDDAEGKSLLQEFELEKVRCHNVVMRNNQKTPLSYCWIEKNSGKRSIAWSKGGLDELKAGEIDQNLVANAKILHLDGHQGPAALAAAKIAKKHGVLLSLDAGSLRPALLELLPLLDIFIASEEFARAYSGQNDLREALRKMAAIGAEVIGCTMGAEGCMLYKDGEFLHCPAFALEVVDTTGCGDVFHGIFCHGLARGWPIEKTIQWASAGAAIKAGRVGGWMAVPTVEEIEDMLRQGSATGT